MRKAKGNRHTTQSRVKAVCMLLAVPMLCVAAPRFLLESQLRTNYGSGGDVQAFTGYHYDSDGNRVSRRVFDGVDSSAALMSTIVYSYDSEHRCIEELLLAGGGDTLSIVRYIHGADGLLSARTLRKDGTVRFRDTLFYEQGELLEQHRYNASDELAFYHRYGYDTGRLTSDTLFEADGGSFTATQARALLHDGDGRVTTESSWRVAGSEWYCISTTVMAYESDNLISATTYETDGSAQRLMDSLAYAYDADGNRVLEEHFDAERMKTYDIVYAWHDTEATPVTAYHRVRHATPRASCRNGRIELGTAVTATVCLCRADGRMLLERRLTNASSLTLPADLAPGRYVLHVTGTVHAALPISTYN